MEELGLNTEEAQSWFSKEIRDGFVLVSLDESQCRKLPETLKLALRRAYLSDDALIESVESLATIYPEDEISSLQTMAIAAKMPDPGSTMAGDFGEILAYILQAVEAYPETAFGPKKWRLKEARNSPAPMSDVVHFILPDWPNVSANDQVLCAEVKMRSTASGSGKKPIEKAIRDCKKDRTSRLAKTLVWMKERGIHEKLGTTHILQLDRFIESDKHPLKPKKEFKAVAVLCSSLIEESIPHCPSEEDPQFSLVLLKIPDLHMVYNSVFETAKASQIDFEP